MAKEVLQKIRDAEGESDKIIADANEKAGQELSRRLQSDVSGFSLLNTENTGDAITKAMQSLQMVLQQTEAERINENAARKSQQNLIMLIVVAAAVYWFVFKD